MDAKQMAALGIRLRRQRERAGYTREQFAELCSLSARFVANVELGTSSISLDTLLTVCRLLSCSSDSLLFGETRNPAAWSDTIDKIEHLELQYQKSIDHLLQSALEVIAAAKKEPAPSAGPAGEA